MSAAFLAWARESPQNPGASRDAPFTRRVGGARIKSLQIGEPTIETARILYLAYGRDALEMAELRCRELTEKGDAEGLANWQRVLAEVKQLVASDPGAPDKIN